MPAAFRIDWSSPQGELLALEPTSPEVAEQAAALAQAYNHPENALLMGHSEAFEPSEVIEHFATMQAGGARPFLLFCDGQFAGDADLRGLRDGAAEFAFMVAAVSAQGRGLGTRFALMVQWFGFSQLGLHHLYASLVPANVASRRVFEKLGFAVDDSATGRGFAEEEGDLVMSIDRQTFERRNADALAELRVASR